jgi:hypothetical protein
LFPSKAKQIRISPVKTRDSQTTRKSLKPFSSSIIQEKRKIMTKEDILKINSKIQLIKSKCMNPKPRLGKSDSKKTLNSMWMDNEPLNESADLDSEDHNENGKSNKVHLLKSVFEDRPPTIFFKYPKCCALDQL